MLMACDMPCTQDPQPLPPPLTPQKQKHKPGDAYEAAADQVSFVAHLCCILKRVLPFRIQRITNLGRSCKRGLGSAQAGSRDACV